MPKLDLWYFGQHAVDELFVHRLLDQQTRASRTNFALVGKGAEECAVDRRLQVSISKDDVWIFAAKFQRNLLNIGSRSGHDLPPGDGPASKGDFVDEWINRKFFPCSHSRAGHNIHDTGWKPDLPEHLRQFERGE